jgi:microsomal dipeptidase-like Zn-dependent dipeptidase
MEVALSSTDVYRIVSAKRLAVVIGIEVDHIGNLVGVVMPMVGVVKPPSAGDLTAEIHRLYGEGVRYIFPIHVIDNAFGGSAAYENLFNVSNFREDGRPYALVCAKKDEDITYKYNSNDLGVENIVVQLVKTGFSVNSISYPPCIKPDESGGQKNSLALTPTGNVAIREMMKLGMLIDVDHMSQAAADATLTLATQFAYPINSGHNGVRGTLANNHNERALRTDQYTTIGKLHGMAGVGSGGLDAQQWLSLYNHVITQMGAGSVGAFGTDTDGFAPGMPRRLKPCPPQFMVMGTCVRPESASSVQYSGAFPRSRDGTKTWDYNVDGVAHYGMLPDFLQDVKSLPGGATMVASFMTGADYFYRTWKTAETKSLTVK